MLRRRSERSATCQRVAAGDFNPLLSLRDAGHFQLRRKQERPSGSCVKSALQLANRSRNFSFQNFPVDVRGMASMNS